MHPLAPPGIGLDEPDKNKKLKITIPLLKRIFSFLLPYKKELIGVVLVILVSSVLGVIPSVLTGKIIDDGLIGKNLEVLIRLVILSVILIVFSNAVTLFEAYLNATIAGGVTYDMKNKLYSHLQKMSYGFFMNRRQGEIITRMTEDVNGVQNVISQTLTKALKNLGTIIITAITLFKTNWILALMGIIFIPLFMIPTRAAGKKRWKIAREIQSNYDESNQILNETLGISGQMLVKLFNREQDEYDKFEKINKKVYVLGIKELLTGKLFFITLNIYSNCLPLLVYLVGGVLMMKYQVGPTVTVGELSIIVTLLTRVHHPLNELLNLNVDITRSLALFERLFEYFDLEPDIKDSKNAVNVGRLQGNIEFKNVSFSYNENQKILNNISFSIHTGETFALAGSSGAGKSTLITLLPRLYDVSSGKITIDGIDIRKMTQQSLRENIGMVTQDTYLFNASILENLRYANKDASFEEIVEACKRANIHDFIDSLPEKYDTLVGNRGLRLSGGEKQRISIARVILKNPPIIILDEATSSLDSISESYIQKAIEPLLKDRTALVVAHRLSTIISSDEIAVIEEGTIVSKGTHEKLLRSCDIYRQFFETQFKIPLKEEAL